MLKIDVEPFLVEKPWGGDFISKCLNLTLREIGEAFFISTLNSQESVINGIKLSEHLGFKLSFLIKLIDANENLSVQIHPNDFFAKKLQNSVGKTECWLITESTKGAGIYFGLKPEISKTSFYKSVNEKKDVSSMMNFIQVEKNDFIVVPAGTIHAIGAGIRLLEFQQSSGITYRIWDWNRIGRELHLDEAELVSNDDQNPPCMLKFKEINRGCFFKHNDFELFKESANSIRCISKKNKVNVLIETDTFKCFLEKTL